MDLNRNTGWKMPRLTAGRKIVLVGFGTYGDIRPLIMLARELLGRGHQAILATAPEYRSLMRIEGVPFAPVHPTGTPVTGASSSPQSGGAGPQPEMQAIRSLVMPQLEQSVADAMKVMDGAALAVVGTLAFGGRLAAMKRGLPWLSAVVQPAVFMSAYDLHDGPELEEVHAARRELGPDAASALLRTLLRRRSESLLQPEQHLRAKLGLPPGAGVLFDDTFSPQGTIGFFSPLLGSVEPDFPPLTRIVGFPRYEHPGARLPEDLEAFLRAGSPPLVFSCTNLFHIDKDLKGGGFFGECIAAARALNRRTVLLTATDMAQIPPGPDVFVCPFVSHPLIFPHAEAIIHNGGIGTIYGALRAGRPQLNVPISVDQPDNARRTVRLGVAATLPYGSFTAQSAAAALRGLLSDPQVAQRCAELAPIVEREDGAGEAATIIESMLMLSPAQRNAMGA